MEAHTELSCFPGAGFAPPAVASPLLADGWAQPHGAGAELGTVLGPPAARGVPGPLESPDSKGLVQNYNLEQREGRLTLLIYLELEERAVCQSGSHMDPTLFRS